MKKQLFSKFIFTCDNDIRKPKTNKEQWIIVKNKLWYDRKYFPCSNKKKIVSIN